ncbi:phage tail protein [Rudanella paleaurantiibacter]|nr:tail fiber protein [Rudanella paleaurantiibacter]
MVAFNYAPQGWAQCNGQILPINQNQALFSLLGTTYGGDGRVNFALPDLRGRLPMHWGDNFILGQVTGATTATLNISNLPAHTHDLTFRPPCNTGPGTTNNPTGAFPAATTTGSYGPNADVNLAVGSTLSNTGSAGGGQPFTTMQPYTVINFVIALQGVYPTQN